MKTKLISKALTFLFLALIPCAFAGTYTANYLGGGIWEAEPGAWSTTAYPFNHHLYVDANGNSIPDGDPLYHVVINNAVPCALGKGVSVESVTVSAGSTLNLSLNASLSAMTGGFLNNGQINMANNTILSGFLINQGVIHLDATDYLANIIVSTGSIFKSGSQILMNGQIGNQIFSLGHGDALTIEAGASVQGSGKINPGFFGDTAHLANITNRGLIEATHSSQPLNIGLAKDVNAHLTNTGTLQASGGGTLQLLNFSVGGNVFNSGGAINALDGSKVVVGANVTVVQGTLNTSGSGVIEGQGGTLENVTSNGAIAIRENQVLYLSGGFTNNGTVLVNGATNGLAFLRVLNGAPLNGAVTLTCASNGNCGVISGGAPGTTPVTFASNATIQGSGFIGDTYFSEGPVRVSNQGLIHANQPDRVIFIRSYAYENSAFTNDGGTLRASNGGTLHFLGASTIRNNGGTLQAAPNSKISGEGGQILAQSSGTLDLNGGTFDFPSGLDLNGGQLIGSGIFNGPIRNNGGIVGPGHSPGLITINGDYTQGANGVLNMEIGGTSAGTEYDQLKVNGTAILGGTLNVSLINGFRPAVGAVFQLIVPSASQGSFAAINTVGFSANAASSNGQITLTVTSVPDIPLNISTRMHVGTDPNQLIGGFIVTGSEPKKVIVLATGPSLADFGLTGVLADPVLELFQGNTLIASNDDWKIPAQADVEASGLKPGRDAESALVRTLAPGAYSAVVRGKTGTGIGTVQVYDLSQDSKSKLANISSRGLVQAEDSGAMIAGFFISGNGGADARVIVRALGPSLSAFGIAGALADPTLELKNANGATLASNDEWEQSAAAAEISSRSLAPGNMHESALAISLPGGGYTAIVRGHNGGTGVGTVEVYNVE